MNNLSLQTGHDTAMHDMLAMFTGAIAQVCNTGCQPSGTLFDGRRHCRKLPCSIFWAASLSSGASACCSRCRVKVLRCACLEVTAAVMLERPEWFVCADSRLSRGTPLHSAAAKLLAARDAAQPAIEIIPAPVAQQLAGQGLQDVCIRPEVVLDGFD